jgi:hypothetical protein
LCICGKKYGEYYMDAKCIIKKIKPHGDLQIGDNIKKLPLCKDCYETYIEKLQNLFAPFHLEIEKDDEFQQKL